METNEKFYTIEYEDYNNTGEYPVIVGIGFIFKEDSLEQAKEYVETMNKLSDISTSPKSGNYQIVEIKIRKPKIDYIPAVHVVLEYADHYNGIKLTRYVQGMNWDMPEGVEVRKRVCFNTSDSINITWTYNGETRKEIDAKIDQWIKEHPEMLKKIRATIE